MEARKVLKISQGTIAEAIGITQSALSQQDSNKKINIKALEFLSNTYNVNMNWIFTGEGNISKAKEGNRALEDEVMRLQGLIEEYQDQILMLVRDKKKLEDDSKKAG